MATRRWYPVFLDLEAKRVLVVGGGKVALRKVRGLVEAGARVTVVAPEFDGGFEDLSVERIVRPFEDGDLEGAVLVFAATGSRKLNRRVGELAAAGGIPANVADSSAECAFIVPARVFHEGLHIAISTGGVDPSRAVRMRKKLERWLAAVVPRRSKRSP